MLEELGRLIEKIYGDSVGFVVAYQNNSELVFYRLIREIKVVPIDFKEILFETFKDNIKQEEDTYA